jgi:hypothetical protein
MQGASGDVIENKGRGKEGVGCQVSGVREKTAEIRIPKAPTLSVSILASNF